MKGKIKCLSCSSAFTILFIIFLSFQCFAADYGAQYPDYVNQSSGCFIECQTNLGRGTLVFAKNYQKDYVGFIGDKYNLMNIQSGTINAQLVLTNGTEYTVRASAFSQFQYRTQNNSTYNDLTVSQIYNTNVQFADEKGDRGNVIHSFNEYEISTVFALVLLLIASIVNTLLLLFRRS